MKRTFTLLSCVVLFTLNLHASWQWPITNYFQKDYNAGTQTWQIRQQKNGWMYFANNYGLLEFDGNTWTTYGIYNSSVIRSLEIADDGTIFVGGANEYGKFTSNKFGGLTYEPLSQVVPDAYKTFEDVWNIHLVDNELFVQTRHYIFRHNITTNTVNVIQSDTHIFLSAKIDNNIFVATSNGIYLLTGNNLTGLRGSEQLVGREIRAMVPYKNGVLIGTDFDGLFLFDGSDIKRFKTDADQFLRTNQLYTISVNNQHIAIGTVKNGLVITDNEGKNCRYINNENGLQNNTILSLLFDDDGCLWLGLDQGIDLLSVDSPISQLYSHNNSYGAGYTSIIANGHLYIGTNQGLYHTNFPLETQNRLSNLQLIPQSLGQVWSIDSIGKSLFCCHNRGLFQIVGNRLLPLNTEVGFWRVRTLSDKNIAIAGSYNGLYLLRNENGQYTITKLEGYNTTSRIFEIDEHNHIWIIGANAIERLTLNEDKTAVSVEEIIPFGEGQNYYAINKVKDRIVITGANYCLVTNNDGNLIQDSLFFKRYLDGEKFYNIIIEDKDKTIWYIDDNIVKARTFDTVSKTYRPSSILWNAHHSLIGGFENINVIGNGQVICGCISGFMLGNLHSAVEISQEDLNIYLRHIIATKEQDSVLYGESYPIIPTNLKIEYDNNSLLFNVGGIFSPNDTYHYTFRLSPEEQHFSAWGGVNMKQNNNLKEYTNLDYGDYTLTIRATSSTSGTISEREFNFTILPPWYCTWWAWIIWSLLILFACYTIIRYIRSRVERSKRKLAYQKDAEMRKREHEFMRQEHEREKQILQLQNERVELELKNKSSELANMMLNQLNRNELLTDIKHDLKKISAELQAKNPETAAQKIVLLQSKLSRNIGKNVDWEKYEENFDIVHNRFLKKLSERFPWLTKSERKLCIYIHMGLLTKEIAPLMNISTRGVEMLRYRMRKKMQLDRGDDIERFFQEIAVESEK